MAEVKQRLLKRYSKEEIDAIIDLYASAYGDSGLTAQEVLEEILCDAMGQMNAFATEATERVAGEVGVFLRNVRKAAKDTGATKNTTGEGGVKYSRVIEETDSVINISREQRIQNVLDVARMDSVFSVEEDKLNGVESSITDVYTNQFAEWGNVIHSKKFGEIDTKKSAVKSEIAHGSTKEKIASIEAIPDVIDKGKIISIIEKGHGLSRVTIAAPVLIGKTKYYMGVMLNKDTHAQRLYIHDVTISKEAFGFSQEHLSTTGHGKKRKNLFLSSILNNISVVKYKSELNRTYMEAVQNGNMEAAQRVVDQAAIVSGAMVMPSGKIKAYYHGTNKSFTSFDVNSSRMGNHGFGLYFTMMKSFASEYGSPIGVYIMTDRIATHEDHEITKSQVERVVKNFGISEEAITNGQGSMTEWIAAKNDASILQDLQKALVRHTKAQPYEMLKFFQKVFGYDGLRVTRETVLWDNRLVKSSDPVTYDDNGNVIPLFERFDTENSDIRYSREMDTVKALERQNALMKERWEYWKGQAQTTKTAKADKAEVRKLARDILRGYSSDTRVEDILPDLQRLANQNDSYSDMVTAAEGIARKVLEGSGVDVNGDLEETRKRLKKYLRIKWMQAGKL